MIKLLWRFSLLVLLAVFFTWLANRPGSVTVQWLGYEIMVSFVAGVAALLLAMVVLWFLWSLVHRVWRSPASARSYLRSRKNRKAYESLSRGIIAAGAGDAQAAARHAAIAGNGLADEPLVNVLAAQAAQLRGDRNAVRRIFDEMAKTPETEALGLRGLFAEARQNGDTKAAMEYAERALRINPRLAWASTAALQLQTLRKDWGNAAITLQQQTKSGVLSAAEGTWKQAYMLTAQALALEASEPMASLSLALKAHKLDPALVPAALVAARCHASQNNPRKAAKVIKETWALSPHPDLAEVMSRISPSDNAEQRYDRLRDLTGSAPRDLEPAFALARAALEARRFDVARTLLEPHSHDRPQARICAVMAEVEEAAGDAGRAREWLSRAIRAPRDPMWVSDGVASPRWVAVSPVTGEIVPCQWKTPFDMPDQQRLAKPEKPDALPHIAAATPPEKPVMVEHHRPPDDPGPDPGDGPATKSLATDG
jgi:HemY protein